MGKKCIICVKPFHCAWFYSISLCIPPMSQIVLSKSSMIEIIIGGRHCLIKRTFILRSDLYIYSLKRITRNTKNSEKMGEKHTNRTRMI